MSAPPWSTCGRHDNNYLEVRFNGRTVAELVRNKWIKDTAGLLLAEGEKSVLSVYLTGDPCRIASRDEHGLAKITVITSSPADYAIHAKRSSAGRYCLTPLTFSPSCWASCLAQLQPQPPSAHIPCTSIVRVQTVPVWPLWRCRQMISQALSVWCHPWSQLAKLASIRYRGLLIYSLLIWCFRP